MVDLSIRAQGQFPLSIATSLAIESALGVLPDAPATIAPITQVSVLWINIRTLFRNLVGSFEKEARSDLRGIDLALALVNEQRTIETLIAESTDSRCRVSFYRYTYASLPRKFPKANLIYPTSPQRKIYDTLENHTYLCMDTELSHGVPFYKGDTDIPQGQPNALILTHYPVDLLNRYNFTSLSLLESHTGTVKPYNMWNTKLNKGNSIDVSRLPFDRMTLQLYGDGVTFAPLSLPIRRKLIELANKHNWTPMTTKEYVIYCVENKHDPLLEILIKELYRH